MREEFTNNAELTEDAQVSGALKQLKRATAPADFDMRVKAKIATQRSNTRSARVWLFPRLAIPAALAVLFLGAFVVYFNSGQREEFARSATPQNIMTPSDPATEQTTANEEVPQSTTITTDALPAMPEDVAVTGPPTVQDNIVTGNTAERNVRNARAANAIEEPRAGSLDIMLSGPEKVVTIGEMRNTSVMPDLPAADVLKKSGIETVVNNGIWQIISISEGSSAARSGLMVGDRIESIDGRKHESAPLFSSDHKVKALVLKKDDGTFKVIEIAN